MAPEPQKTTGRSTEQDPAKAKAEAEAKKKARADAAASKKVAVEAARAERKRLVDAKKADAESAKAARAEARKNFQPKAKLTNSQRRALHAVAQAGGNGLDVSELKPMAASPFTYLVEVGLIKTHGSNGKRRVTTDAGKVRAKEINIEKYAKPAPKEKATAA